MQSRCRGTSRTRCAYGPQSLVVALIHNPEYDGNGCLESEAFRACELGSLARLSNSIQNRPFLVKIETACSFYHIEYEQ
jgi:hypothetical protein